MADGAVRFPLVHEELAGFPSTDPAAPLMARAESHEMRDANPAQALEEYRRAAVMAQSGRARALALARVARCFTKMRQPDEAAKVWQVVAERHADEYDLFGRPFGLVAKLELPGSRSELYGEMVKGRWELNAEQLDYFREKLGIREAAETDFTEQLRLASAFDSDFRRGAQVREDGIYPFAIQANHKGWHFFYAPMRASGHPDDAVAISIDPAWIRKRLAGFELRSRGERSANDMRVGFKDIFPYWEISTESVFQQARAASARWSLLISVSAVAIVLLFLRGVRMVVRDAWATTTREQFRDRYLREVSHGLKTPLSVIRLHAETMLGPAPLTEALRRDLCRDIVEEGEQVRQLVGKLLVISRLEARPQLQLRTGDLATALGSSLDAYCRHLAYQGVGADLHLATGLPPVRFDATAIKEAALNLIDNAVKYSSGTADVHVRVFARENQAICEVEDRGSGIAPEERDRIFEHSYRGSNAAGIAGQGVGLFVVREIMAAHGGSVEVASEPGRGSTFRLVFPVEDSNGENPDC
jgi:signal transduction histidine kinase